MTETVFSARDVRIFMPGIAPRFSKMRAAATLRRLWRAYWDYHTRRATVVILHALDDRVLADIGIERSEIESRAFDTSADWMRRIEAMR